MARSPACRYVEPKKSSQKYPALWPPPIMNLALFDFDHTLSTVDTYGRFLRTIATPPQLSGAKWKIGPWLAGYRLGVVSAQGLRARATRLAFSGRSQQEIMQLGERFATEVLPGTLRPEMMHRLQQHQSNGDEVAIVSGSLDAYLQPWCAQHGLALICNRLEAEGDLLTGRYEGGDCGADKVARISARHDLGTYARITAYGDSREDLPMLALAHERWYRGHRVA